MVSQRDFVTWLGAQTCGKSKPALLLLASDAQPLKPLQTAPQQKVRILPLLPDRRHDLRSMLIVIPSLAKY